MGSGSLTPGEFMDKFIDWHPADIVAGLRKRGHRWQQSRDGTV
jgi:lambda repressor-like predicted transcriptional regulator